MLGSAPITPRSGRSLAATAAAAAGPAAHVAVVAWTFAPALFSGRMPYLRDLSTFYYPNLVFLERCLAAGTFPLWIPNVDAGTPFLLVYPPDLLLVAIGGASAAFRLGPPLHMLAAALGTAALGRRLGLGGAGATAAGIAFALSGFMVSVVNLTPLHQAAALAPLVLLAALRCAESPTGRRVAVLGFVLALQVSTFAGEVVLQTAAAAVVLLWGRVRRPGLRGLFAAGVLAALLAAPALMGAADLLAGTRRAAGFDARHALAASLAPAELVAGAIPRFFGDLHTFTNVGFWGQSVFPGGFPYLLTVYAGLTVVTAALAAGRDRLWWLVGAGIALALGAHGPFAALLAHLALFRAPVKLVFLAALGLALLAGRGVDRARATGARWWIAIPGAGVAALGLLLTAAPAATASALAAFRALADPAAQAVIRTAWPAALVAAGILACAAAAALIRGARLAPLAVGALAMDLLLANGDVNRFAPAAFYDLRPAVRALLQPALSARGTRVFGYTIGNTPGLPFAPEVLVENSDVRLYHLDRQVLWGRTPVLDGLEGALDEDRTGAAPAGATLTAAEATPARFRDVVARLRGANVRYVLSFAPLPPDLADERGSAPLPEVLVPLRLYEIRDALPRAFFAADPSAPADSGRAPLAAEALADGPHRIVVRADTPPGHVVVLSGWKDGWTARGGDGNAVEVRRAGERYFALPTPGGAREWTVEYAPRWWPRSLALLALGAVAALALALRRPPPPA